LSYGYERVPFGIPYKILNCSLHIFFFLEIRFKGKIIAKKIMQIHTASGK
jgi:hypothetical protein